MNQTKNQRFLACPNRHCHLNKRGFLLASETVKIVIAVICIIFLVFFLTQLYFSKVAEEKGRQAASTLINSTGSIKTFVDDVKTNKIPKTYFFQNPVAWYVFTFTGTEKKPNSCSNINCICICEDVADYFDRQITYCDEDGACLIIPDLEDRKIEEEIIAQKGMTISYEGNLIKLIFISP